MGGDITGKTIIPIIKELNGKCHATFLGNKRVAGSEEELQDLQRVIRFAGYYQYMTNPH